MHSKFVTLALLLIAVFGIGTAYRLYPAENEFSIMRCTVSFLGSPDPDRNPPGWRWHQLGMSSLILALSQMIWWRHRNFLPFTGPVIRKASALYAAGFALIFLAVWIVDSDNILWAGIREGVIHTQVAIIGILTLLVAVSVDGVTLTRAGLPKRSQWPFKVYACMWVVTIFCLASWQWQCWRDPGLKHWPGEGIYSTPMWEWLLLAYLIGFVIWISRRRLAETMPVRD